MHVKHNFTGLKTFISFIEKHLSSQKLASTSWLFNDCLPTHTASTEKDNLMLLLHRETFCPALKLLPCPWRTTGSHLADLCLAALGRRALNRRDHTTVRRQQTSFEGGWHLGAMLSVSLQRSCTDPLSLKQQRGEIAYCPQRPGWQRACLHRLRGKDWPRSLMPVSRTGNTEAQGLPLGTIIIPFL